MSECTKGSKNIFENERLIKLIMKFSIPCVIALLADSLYGIVDQIFIANGVGFIGNAATNIAFPISVIAIGFGLMFGDGGAALYSMKLGEKDIEGAIKVVHNSIAMLVLCGILFTLCGYLFMPQLLNIFGATDTNYTLAKEYLFYSLPGLTFLICACGLSAIIRADGDPKYSMGAVLSGAFINLILDIIFIFGFNMGIKGAAIATAVGEILSGCIALSYLRKFKNINLTQKVFKMSAKIISRISLIGISDLITQICVGIIIIVSNNMLALYGAQSIYGSEVCLSAMAIVMKVNEIFMAIIIGIAAGGQPIAGYNYGAKNYRRVKDTFICLVKITTVVAIIGFIFFRFFPYAIVRLFGQSDYLFNNFAVKAMKIYLCMYILNGFELTSSIFLQSIGKPYKAIILTISKQFIFIIPLLLILPQYFEVYGVLYAGPISEICSFIAAFIVMFYEIKNIEKLQIMKDC
ncbi:MATE family efflux transporter [Clostridium sp. BJN0001]|uniref:MATE family efflux transporter n=1 Tax=Clostridium sp. BJN0001 TaxID=2930219 RepID=UPI001FD1E158|nr:MATE family efflux transporter [Clostridium sp. BJN0001]